MDEASLEDRKIKGVLPKNSENIINFDKSQMETEEILENLNNKNVTVIIPCCGNGVRFKDNGYQNIKPLIQVFEKEIICYVLDENKKANIYVIINNKDIQDKLTFKYPHVNFVNIGHGVCTKGAAETLLLGISKIEKNKRSCFTIRL